MKICIVTDAWKPQVNGVVRTLEETTLNLKKLGHQVLIINPSEFKTFPCPTYPEIRLSLFPGAKVSRLIREFNPDHLHISTEGPLGLAARGYAKRNNLTFTSAYHTRFPEYVYARTFIPLKITYFYVRWFHKLSKLVMVPTETVKKDLIKWNIQNPQIWSRGVDLKIFKPDLKKKKNKKPILLNIGRVSVEKNLEDFLKIDLPSEKWVVGAGPALNFLKLKYPEVKFFGEKSKFELAEFYNKADIFVFPSKTDTFGLVLLEAMACGLPVAAYPVTGPIDVIGNSGAGYLDKNLKNACKKALKINKNIPLNFAKQFSWESTTQTFEKYLAHTKENFDKTYDFNENPHKGNNGLSRAFNASKNSWSGLVFAIREESAFRQELLLVIFSIALILLIETTSFEKFLMVFTSLLILIVELLNSSVEAAVDRISYDYHGLSKRAKDYGSAAVLITILIWIIVHLYILLN